jgi:hypothetical protein
MSERDGYEHGVPCFVSGVFPDPDAAASIWARWMSKPAFTMDIRDLL